MMIGTVIQWPSWAWNSMGVLERGKNRSDVGRNEGGLGGLLGQVAWAERTLLRKVDLPFGLSVIAIGRKPM